jgi:predicted RND superfamily exporter protein
MTAFNRFIIRNPWLTIAVFALVTVAFAWRLPSLRMDFDIDAMLPQWHSEIQFKNWTDDYFGVEAPVVLTIENDGPNGIFTPHTLGLVQYLSSRIAELESLDGDDLISLSDIDNISSDGDMLVVQPFFDAVPKTQQEADAIRADVLGNPMMLGTVVSEDAAATIVAAEILPGIDKEALYDALKEIIAAAPATAETITISGRPVVEGEISTINREDLSRLAPYVVAVVAVVLWLTLGCVRGVLLPLLVVACAVAWTLGALAWTGRPLSAVNSVMPTILIPIGIADGIHVIHQFLRTLAARPELDRSEAAFDTMQNMWMAVVMTSITTAVGIGSMAVSSLESSRDFAIFTSFGVIAAMICSLTLLPAFLAVLPRPRPCYVSARSRQAVEGRPLLERLAARAADFATQRNAWAIAGGLTVVTVCGLFLPAIVVDGSLVANLPAGNAVRVGDDVARHRFNGTVPVEIVLDGGGIDAWKQPEKLRAMEAFQEWFEAMPETGASRSIADYVKRMNAVMNPDDPSGYRVPDNQELVAQYLLLYSISGQPDDFDDVVDYDYALANVRGQINSDHSPVLESVIADIDEYAAANLAPLGIEAHASGASRQMHVLMGLIIGGQIGSLGIALPFVVVVAALMLSSFLGGLITAIPVLIATVVTFGFLGMSGVTLGVTTSIMGSLGIGIGVDYAVHFVVRYRQCRGSGLSPDEAMHATMQSSGVAILYNALVIVAGFSVLATSAYLPPQALGWLVSLNMVVCFLATVTTLAALLHRLQPDFVLPQEADNAERSQPETSPAAEPSTYSPEVLT